MPCSLKAQRPPRAPAGFSGLNNLKPCNALFYSRPTLTPPGYETITIIMEKPFTPSFGAALMVPFLSLLVALPGLAQGPEGRPPRDDFSPPRDDFGPPRDEKRDNGKRSREMRPQRGAAMQLERLWRGIGRLERGENSLSKAQSQRVVSLVLPWSNQPQMSRDEAQTLRQKLENVLTATQKNEVRNARPSPPRRGRTSGENRGGDFDGPPRGGGPERDFDGPPQDRIRRDNEMGDEREDMDRPRGRRPRDIRGENKRGENGGEGRGPMRERGDERGDGPGRGGAMRGLSASEFQTVRAWIASANPFYAPTGTATWKQLPAAFQTRIARNYQENRATLEMLSRRAKG